MADVRTYQAEVFVEGLYFGEGPRWHDGKLWLSDFYDHAVKVVDPASGAVHIELRLDGDHRPSGLGWLPDGRLLVVSMLDRRVLRREHDGKLVEHADLSGLAAFHCNDMVVDAAGGAYVGNFGFDLDTNMKEKGVEWVIGESPSAVLSRIDPDGTVKVAAEDMRFPNGTVITPDGATMIIAETLGMRLTAFDIAEDGSLSNRRVWAETPGIPPDGIALDADGGVWVANPFGTALNRFVEGGAITDTVVTSQPSYACMLGGEDRRTLYALTAASSDHEEASSVRTGKVEVARVEIPGAGRP